MLRRFRRLFARPRSLVALTRQGALAAARRVHAGRVISPARKTLLVLAGSSLIGTGVALFIHARLGLSPYDVALSAIAEHAGTTHGQAAWIASGSLFAIAAVLGQRPSRYGLLFVAMNGIAVDTASALVENPNAMAVRGLFVLLGLGAITGGIAVVVHSSSTGGPFELLSAAGAQRGLNPTHVRTGMEITLITGGVVAGGSFGVATILFAMAIGPLLGTALQALGDHRAGRMARVGSRES